MRAGVVGVVHRTPFATSLPLRHVRARVTCSSSSGHISFIKDVAATRPPENLHHLLEVLQTRGESIRSPGSRHGLIPLAIPLSENLSAFATQVDQFIHRILVEEDVHGSNGELFHASSEAGKKLYTRGDFAESQISSLDVYILKKVGLFPDVLEHKVMRHFEEGDQVSALVTGEFYTKKELFPGFGRPFVFNAESRAYIRSKRFCKGGFEITMVDFRLCDVASIAQWEDEQIEYIKEKVTEEGRQEDLKKGKAPAQVALDEAAFLLDLASIEGTWGDYVDRIAECYKEAGLNAIADFILYRD
ncbi:hypothetical protein QQP08_005721 [Theobroma cacao]|nr:hypothetical protein QQP08_005721 [Theobroma cacao]